MKVIFFGSSDFSIPFLKAVHDSRHNVLLVITGPEKGRGRGRIKTPNTVKAWADEAGIDCLEIDRFSDIVIDRINETGFDYLILVSFGKVLPAVLIDMAAGRTINVHPSLLPRYRGPSPIISAILGGDEKTGISLIKLSRKVDEGEIYMQREIRISESDNKDALEQKIIDKGVPMMMELLDMLESGDVRTFPQLDKNASYTRLFTREDFKIDWRMDSYEIYNRIRAFSTTPGSFTSWKGKDIKILEASRHTGNDRPEHPGIKEGLVVSADRTGLLVGCGDGRTISILKLQPPGKSIMKFNDFINGYRIKPGDFFE